MLRSLSWKITSPVVIIAIVCTLLFSLVSPFLIERFVKEAAVENAKELVRTFRGVRNYFSENVVKKIRASGNFHITAMHKSDKLGIPVPATFLMEMVDYDMSSDQITTNFTSPYPFRNRVGRKQDAFQQRAWQALSETPEDFYVELEKTKQETRVRVAQADRLSEQACVDCHNNHPDSLQRGWRLNDVRGLLEVNTVVDGWLQRGIEISRILTAISLLCFVMIILVNYRAARRVSAPLAVLTNSLNQLSQGQTTKLDQIKPAYHELAELNDAFIGFSEKEHQRRALQKEVEQLAYYDPLTGLENRTGFQRSLDQLLTTQRNLHKKVTLLIVDIDRFRDINDTLGYQAGDQILCAIAQKLAQIKPAEGVLARLSEDNFAIALAADQHGNDEGADGFFANVIQLLSEPMCWHDNQVMLSVNVGTSCSSHQAKDSAEMLIQANIALYAAKEGGRNKAVKHLPALSQAALARVDLVRDIAQGVENDEFIPFYQPQFCIETGKIIGAEALMRWRRSDGRLVSPNEFIPSAEQSHLIVPMGASILAKACQACHQWQREAGLEGVRVAVNVSSVQFIDQDMKTLVSDTLSQTGLKPKLLELEITESAMLDDVNRVITILSALRELGVELALDDFGTGYSSLSYLKLLPIDRLKIDRAFVKDLSEQPEDRAILAMVCQLGQQLSLKVLAEGVEDKEQIQMLADAGCEEVQGFYYAKPMPIDDFIAFARQYSQVVSLEE
ncbi:MAG: EAL domain-containing protein [Oceanospirillaceae bacterium]